MLQRLAFLFALLLPVALWAQPTPHERSGFTKTATWAEATAYSRALAQQHSQRARLLEVGTTDIGLPLHLLVLSGKGHLTPEAARASGQPVVLIINNIHPGEPEGVDASLALARDLLTRPNLRPLLDQVVWCVIPVYNVDGTLNRGRPSRANQNGPVELGFRGNARNLDLNRDFVKLDSRNAQSYAQLFQAWRPHVLIDNHTSNGADYQHVMTLLTTQRDKLAPLLREWLHGKLVPALYADMQQAGFPMIPYANLRGETPEQGIAEFNDGPRYSSGHAGLFHCVGLVAETHMLKPFPDRVKATYALNLALLRQVAADAAGIVQRRKDAEAATEVHNQFELAWTLDTTRRVNIPFLGYTATREPSAVTGQPRLKYDRSKPWQGTVPYFPHHTATATATKPYAYVIPQAWTEVIQRLKWNGVLLRRLAADTTLDVQLAHITSFETVRRPYEGHYLHYAIKPQWTDTDLLFRQGDYVAEVSGPSARYLIETLEPEGPDSFLAWGFFDSIFQQKEGFSDYVWEDRAAQLLAADTSLRRRFTAWRTGQQPTPSPSAQLDWVYKNSVYYEPTHNRYPVARLVYPVRLHTKQD